MNGSTSTRWLLLAALGTGTLLAPRMAHAQSDPGPVRQCETDADCDDGIYCNGTEYCYETLTRYPPNSYCGRRALPTCDDGIACTTDSCSEARRGCKFTPADADGDGHYDAACLGASGKPIGDDCDDQDPRRFPGNTEVCDAHDEDCDPKTVGYRDADGDGSVSNQCCNGSGASKVCGPDCNDQRTDVAPFLIDVCDGLDNDCNGKVDDGEICQPCGGKTTLYVDADGDGFGDPNSAMSGCANATQYATRGGDCDDSNPSITPGAEVCADGTSVRVCGQDGAWTPHPCLGPGERCLAQVDGTAVCLP